MQLELPAYLFERLQAAIAQGIEDGFTNAKMQQQAGWRACIDHVIKPDSPCPVCALAEAGIRIGQLAAQLEAVKDEARCVGHNRACANRIGQPCNCYKADLLAVLEKGNG